MLPIHSGNYTVTIVLKNNNVRPKSREYSFTVQITDSNSIQDPNVIVLSKMDIFDCNTTKIEVLDGRKVYLPILIERDYSKISNDLKAKI